MGMHEFHITAYVLTCDECGTRYGGFGEYLDIPDLYQHAVSAGWQADDDHHYYCPEHWQFNCRTCGRRYSRPNPDTEEGTRWVETHGRDCPECIRKKNLAKFEEQAKKLGVDNG